MESSAGKAATLEVAASPVAATRDASRETPGSAATSGVIEGTWERALAVEREELLANVTRLTRAITLGGFMWPCFGVMDCLVVSYVRPGIGAWLLSLRLIGCALLPLLVIGIRRRPPSTAAGLLAYDCGFFTVGAGLISLMCVEFDGLSSPYAAGIPLVLVCRGAFVAMPWRTALLPNSLAATSYPAILLGSAAFHTGTRAQLSEPIALVHFGLSLAFIFSTLLFSVIGGHSAWSLRRQLFEARSVGRYRLIKRIGHGGMGEVWSALHPGLKRHVAMKILQPRRRSDPVALRRFEREVRATSELSHPNAVRIFDYGVTADGLWYYTMELLSGEELSRLVDREGALSVARAVRLLGQAAGALGEAHARGIVHRDVKPENLFIASSAGELEFVKVLDFGIAKLMRDDTQTGLTAEGWIGGTPAYMSPEVVAGRAADARSDVYALSAVLYFAITGCHVFEGASVPTLLVAHLQQVPEPPSVKLGSSLPARLEAFILRNLAKDPALRCANANEFAKELALCCDE